MNPDERPWLPIAESVLKGHYDKSDSSTRESILIGIRSINHPTTKKAVEYMKSMKPPKKVT